MKIQFKGKKDVTDKDPSMIVMYETGEENSRKKHVQRVNKGEVLDLPDIQAFSLCNTYKDCFVVISHGENSSEETQTKKSLKDYPNKAIL